MKWGYQIPKFKLLINARVETAHLKKRFIPFLKSNRCVVIIEGYFEWKDKTPYCFHPSKKGHDHIYLASFYTQTKDVVILTRQAKENLNKIHNRMPVILSEDLLDLWLNTDNKYMDFIDKKILHESNSAYEDLKFYKLAPYVNKIKNKDVKCLMTKENYMKHLDSVGIKKYFGVAPKKKKIIPKLAKEEEQEL